MDDVCGLCGTPDLCRRLYHGTDFKLMDISATAVYIASAGLPLSKLLAWLAALLELALIVCFLTGAYFSEAALAASAYVLFLAFAFHGQSRWAGDQAEFGFFVANWRNTSRRF